MAAYDNQQERIKQIQNFVDRNRTQQGPGQAGAGPAQDAGDKMDKVTPPPSDKAPKFELPKAGALGQGGGRDGGR